MVEYSKGSPQDPIVDEREVAEWFALDDSEPEPTSSGEDVGEKYTKSQLRVVRETKDWQLDYLQMALDPKRRLIDVRPSYQRRDRWDRKKQSRLIESFLMNIPIPPIFLYEIDYNEYEVIDGRQRLETLRMFLSNDFALTGLEFWSELDGKRFNDLPTVIKKGLMRRSLSAVVLMAETDHHGEGDLDVRRILFGRLNTGGVKLNNQEVRNALYPGPLNSLLHRLSCDRVFTRIWGIPDHGPEDQSEDRIPESLFKNAMYSQMADLEIVLRFFSLRDALVHGRKGSLREILDRFMKNNAQLPSTEVDEFVELFTNSLYSLDEIFAGSPFTLPGTSRKSRPLYDALMVAHSMGDDIDNNHNAIRKRLTQALTSSEETYGVLVGRGNTIQAIRDRVALAREILTGDPQ